EEMRRRMHWSEDRNSSTVAIIWRTGKDARKKDTSRSSPPHIDIPCGSETVERAAEERGDRLPHGEPAVDTSELTSVPDGTAFGRPRVPPPGAKGPSTVWYTPLPTGAETNASAQGLAALFLGEDHFPVPATPPPAAVVGGNEGP